MKSLFGGKGASSGAAVVDDRVSTCANTRLQSRADTPQAGKIDIEVLPNNGDAARFADHSALWHKELLHDDLELVSEPSWKSLDKALTSGKIEDIQNIIVGNPGGINFTRSLNGPMSLYAADHENLGLQITNIPPSPSVSSAQAAAEAVEQYWAALLRDVSFIDYPNNSLVVQAVHDMNRLGFVQSGNVHGPPFPVTPYNLFRGQSFKGDGNAKGPYISQFITQPTFYGSHPLSQRIQVFVPGQDFVTQVVEFKRIQNGQLPKDKLAFDSTLRFLHGGRSLASFTHVDALHQAYFIAALVLLNINAPLNPGSPYFAHKTEPGFGTLVGPDILGTIPEMGIRVLKAVWFRKWIVNLRHRPENYGALVHAALTNRQPLPHAASALHRDVFNSATIPIIHQKFGTFLLPQAFPEGAPAHPWYPTGHGIVAGACVAMLRFFFDGNQKIRPLLLAHGSDIMQANARGTTLVPYTGADRDELTIDGELQKLAWNMSAGHGIHSGIDFRSSIFWSIQLGEQVALSYLRNRDKFYKVPFSVKITQFDGTIATITNEINGG